MSVLFFITTLVVDITIIIMASHEIFNGENLFCNMLAITLGTLSLMLLFFCTFLEMTQNKIMV